MEYPLQRHYSHQEVSKTFKSLMYVSLSLALFFKKLNDSNKKKRIYILIGEKYHVGIRILEFCNWKSPEKLSHSFSHCIQGIN